MVRTHNLKRSIASRFRRMFTRYEQTSRAGRGARFQIHISTDKADKSCKDFCFFLPLFLSKRKRGVRIKKTEALETSVESSMSQAFSLLYINRRAVFYLKTPCFRLNAIIVYHKKIICQ
jgi:hypothetical protein